MATKKKKKVTRKPSAITGAGMKVVKEAAKQAAKAGKKLKYGGKATKTKKDLLVLKSLTDPADKKAIAKAKSIKNRNEIAKKAESKELKRGIKKSRKDAGREKARIREKNKEIDAKNAKRSVHEKQRMLKAELKAKQNYRKSQASKDAEKARNERKLPVKPSTKKVDVPKLKPVSKNNIKKTEVKPAVKKVAKKAVKNSKAKKALLAGSAIGAGIAITSNKKKAVKNKPVKPEVIDNSSRDTIVKKEGDLKSNSKITKPTSKSGSNKIVKPAKEAPKKSGSLTDAASKAFSSEAVKKKFPKGIPPKRKAEAMAKARAYAKKNSNVPWEKLLESITMLLSSHILGRGISKRYK